LNDPPLSEDEVVDVVRVETIEVGRKLFFSAATFGIAGAAPGGGGGADPGSLGGRALGGFGTEAVGIRGTVLLVVSGSDRYGELLSAPVSMPAPVFLNFGMPPANIPASCGGPADVVVLLSSLSLSTPPSLLLRARFGGRGGGATDGRFGRPPSPGIGGALPIGATGPSDVFPSIGADLSLTCVTFFSFAPCSILLKSAPCIKKLEVCWDKVACSGELRLYVSLSLEMRVLLTRPAPPPGGLDGSPPGGGGGGGGPPFPRPMPGKGGGGGGAVMSGGL